MIRHEKKPPPRPPSPADVWQRETNEVCARSMAAWLKGSVNTARPINTLKLDELTAMAENCVSTFIVEISKRAQAAPTQEERDAIIETFLA